MSRKQNTIADAPGQDSFLDVVCNLVGILTILVMLLGGRATQSMTQAAASPAEPQAALENLQGEVASAAAAANDVQKDIHQLQARLQRGAIEVEYRRRERDRINLLLTAAEQELDQRRNQLDESQRSEFDLRRDILAARDELAALDQNRKAIENAVTSPTVLSHLPTPMAKVVFGKELHFQLAGGRITHVPWDDLVERLKADAPRVMNKLKDAPKTVETIGPIGGFWLKYALKRVEKTMYTRAGVAVQQRVELDRFILIPADEQMGESIAEALAPDSDFHSLIKENDPKRTTVTIWVYPEDFGKFREIKHHLYEMGYLAAARPLPEGHPIGGSPDGSRSAAQ